MVPSRSFKHKELHRYAILSQEIVSVFHNTPSPPFDSDGELHHKAVPQYGFGPSKSSFRVSVFLRRTIKSVKVTKVSRHQEVFFSFPFSFLFPLSF